MPARERMRGWADGRVLLLDALSCIELPLQQRGCRDWVRVHCDRPAPIVAGRSVRRKVVGPADNAKITEAVVRRAPISRSPRACRH